MDQIYAFGWLFAIEQTAAQALHFGRNLDSALMKFDFGDGLAAEQGRL